MPSSETVIPLSLRANKAFRADLKLLASLPEQSLKDLASKLGPNSLRSDVEKIAETVAIEGKIPEEQIFRAAGTLMFIIRQTRTSGVRPSATINELNGLLAADGDTERVPVSLAALLEYSKDDRREAMAREALANAPTYAESSFLPVFVPVGFETEELVGGFLWMLEYFDSGGNRQSIAFQVSPGEVKDLTQTIEKAVRTLKRLEQKYLDRDPNVA
jgi:hypothetical protein